MILLDYLQVKSDFMSATWILELSSGSELIHSIKRKLMLEYKNIIVNRYCYSDSIRHYFFLNFLE
jgi:hypothetical protein